MKSKLQSQIHALDRVMYLLDEGSFKHLEMGDDAFAAVVERLYSQVDQEVSHLEQQYQRQHA